METEIKETNSVKFKEPSLERPHLHGDGIQKIWRFKNGFGASVVQFKVLGEWGSYTTDENEWELAVIKFNEKEYKINYETKITNDVIGHLSIKEVEEKLKEIRKL